MELDDVTKVYSIGYMTEPVKVRFRKDVKIDIFNLSVDAKTDDMQMVPRWLANVFHEGGFAELQEPDLGIDLLRALSRERIAGSEQPSPLKPDFYIRLNHFIKTKQGAEKEKLLISLQDIVLLRLGKIIHFARSAPLTSDLEQKLTYEEKTFFRLIHKSATDFKECVLGGGQ